MSARAKRPAPPTPEEIAGHVDRWIAEAGHMPPHTAARLLREKAYWVAGLLGRMRFDAVALTVAEGRLWAAAGEHKCRSSAT